MRSSAPRTLLVALAAGVVGYLAGRSGPEEGTTVRGAPTAHVMEDPWGYDGWPAEAADDPEPGLVGIAHPAGFPVAVVTRDAMNPVDGG